QLADDLAELLGLGLLVAEDAQLVEDRRVLGDVQGRRRHLGVRWVSCRSRGPGDLVLAGHPSIGRSTLTAGVARTVTSDPERGRAASAKARRTARPVLVRQVRNGVEESVHRGDIVEVDVVGRTIRALGDPEHVANLRSAAKPFALLALIEAGGVKEFELEPAELAVMAASHSGEDLHVRTLQALFRRTGISQAMLATGAEGMP